MNRPKVIVVRGQNANPWELRSWERLADEFDVAYLITGSNLYDVSSLGLRQERVRALADLAPSRRLRDFAARTPLNRYIGLARHLKEADIVHAVELSPWSSMQAARAKAKVGFKLVLTVWETIPFLDTYRNAFTRRYRRQTLASTDLFLAVTERARESLLLEGVSPERIEVSPPGIDTDRFRTAAAGKNGPTDHLIISPGRLVWEKGHQDVLRAVALLRQGHAPVPRVLIVGTGPEDERLRRYARDLGIADAVEFRSVERYDEMPKVYARGSCLVLASLVLPRWEEQFGMVLAEGMAAGLPILTTPTGAIPEVVGDHATFFAPGDWRSLATKLAEGPLSRPPGARIEYPSARLKQYSGAAAARRLAAAYRRVLSA